MISVDVALKERTKAHLSQDELQQRHINITMTLYIIIIYDYNMFVDYYVRNKNYIEKRYSNFPSVFLMIVRKQNYPDFRKTIFY